MNKIKKIANIIFLIIAQASFTYMLLFKSIKDIKIVLLLLFISVFLYSILLYKYECYKLRKINCPLKILVAIISFLLISFIFNSTIQTFNYNVSKVLLIFILAIFAFYFIYNSLINIIYYSKDSLIKIYNDFTTTEKEFIIISSTIVLILVFIIYNFTTVFHAPKDLNGNLNAYNVLYTTDSPYLVEIDNVFLNFSGTENDVRQPLFGVFSSFFSIIIYSGSKIVSNLDFVYPVLLSYINYIMIVIIAILFSKLVCQKKWVKIYLFYYF